MRVPKSVQCVALAAIFTAASLMKPTPARAANEAEAGPFIIFAVALTVTLVIIAVNNPTTDSTKTQAASAPPAPTGSSSAALRTAPPPPRVFGITGHF